jgi:hypothetical protein
MITRKDEFKRIADIMIRFKGTVTNPQGQTRGLTRGGRLVHVIIIGNVQQLIHGVTNSHGEGIAWDFIYMDSKNGGLNPIPEQTVQAFFVKGENERRYTFRGVYEVDTANSTEFKVILRRIATEVNEALPEWGIVRFI